jgi:hypothetical protein
MFVVRTRNFQFALMLATALFVSLWPGAGRAYTDEQQQACMGDAFRLCGGEIPDVERVRACMNRNKSQLSPGCRVHFRPEPEAASGVRQRPLSIRAAGSRKHVIARQRNSKKSARSREDWD